MTQPASVPGLAPASEPGPLRPEAARQAHDATTVAPVRVPGVDPRLIAWFGRWWFAGALGAVVVCNFLVVTAASWLPLQDFSAHVEIFDIIARHDDPSTLYPAIYDVGAPFVAGGFGSMLARLFGPALGALFVAKLIVALYLVLTPLALAYVARVFERPRWTVLVAAPLVFNGSFALGFLNFVPAIALGLLAVGVARRFAMSGDLRRGVLLTLLLVLTSYAHVLGYLIALPMVALVLLLHVPQIRLWRRFTPLVLSAPLFAMWVWDHLLNDAPTGAGHTFLAADGKPGMQFWPLEKKLDELPSMLVQFHAGPDGIALFAILTLWLIAMTTAQSGRASAIQDADLALGAAPAASLSAGWRAALRPYTLELIALANLIAFFALPVGVGRDSWYVHERWLVVGAFFFPLWIRREARGKWALLAAAATVVAIWYPIKVAEAARDYERDYIGHLPEAIAALPDQSHLGFMTWDGPADGLRRTPEWHLFKGMHAQSNGGICDTSFAGLPYNGVDYIPGKAPERLRYAFYDDVNLPLWDYVIMWGKGAPTAALASGRIALRWHESAWWLFEVLRPPYRDAPLEGGRGGNVDIAPCPDGATMVGLSVAWRKEALGAFRPLCRMPGASADLPELASATPGVGGTRWLGTPESVFENVHCGEGATLLGLLVRADSVVRGVALRCSDGARVPPMMAPLGGGAEIEDACPSGQRAVGLKARSGDLIDAIGVACTP